MSQLTVRNLPRPSGWAAVMSLRLKTLRPPQPIDICSPISTLALSPPPPSSLPGHSLGPPPQSSTKLCVHQLSLSEALTDEADVGLRQTSVLCGIVPLRVYFPERKPSFHSTLRVAQPLSPLPVPMGCLWNSFLVLRQGPCVAQAGPEFPILLIAGITDGQCPPHWHVTNPSFHVLCGGVCFVCFVVLRTEPRALHQASILL